MEQHTDSVQLVDGIGQLQETEVAQDNLISALNKLRYRELDGLFLESSQQPQNVAQPYFGFSINGEEFVVSARHFCEVFCDIPVAPLPNSPDILLGLVNLRGLLLPVYQLHSYLTGNAPAANGQKTSRKKIVLVIGKGERAVGLLIDSLPVSLSIALPSATDASRSQAVPHPQLPELAQVYLLPDRTLAELAMEPLPERLLLMASESSS